METMITNHVRRKVQSRSPEIDSIIFISGNMIWDRLSRGYLKTRMQEGEKMAVIGIIVFCGVVVGAAAWLLNRPERPKDPEEDREQEEYLTEWSRKHKRR